MDRAVLHHNILSGRRHNSFGRRHKLEYVRLSDSHRPRPTQGATNVPDEIQRNNPYNPFQRSVQESALPPVERYGL
ncbi:MAG: hypothetical protein LBJ67_03475 [Planctomycetaceae bacterium]|nr:hypothetical protein [Planctomycetaceae bacterium]